MVGVLTWNPYLFSYESWYSAIRLYSVKINQLLFYRDADVAVLDSGDVYTAGLQYDEIPFIAEVYNLGTPEYYVVAVAKEEDPATEMTYLKGKRF